MSGAEGQDEGQKEEGLLVSLETYLATGVRIGTRMKSKFTERFIYSVRPDGLYLFDVKKIDERIKIAAKFIARYEPPTVVVVSACLLYTSPSPRD